MKLTRRKTTVQDALSKPGQRYLQLRGHLDGEQCRQSAGATQAVLQTMGEIWARLPAAERALLDKLVGGGERYGTDDDTKELKPS